MTLLVATVIATTMVAGPLMAACAGATAHGMSITFAVAAGLMVLAITIAFVSRFFADQRKRSTS